MTSDSQAAVPRHVCIIMDGNGRWARKRLMPRNMGHRKGVESTRQAVEFCARAGVEVLTVFAFSSENWQRPAEEVDGLMDLFMQSLQQNTETLFQQGIRICFIGERSLFSPELQQQLAASEERTAENTGLRLNVAVNYGGHWDIVNAARRVAEQVARNEIDPARIDATVFSRELSLADCPDPDLFVRTGGEQRISNFLLWQLAYTEFYFCDTLWPDFGDDELQRAFDEYARRQRRFGKTGEQLESPV